jgi:hypothetical protein
MFKRIHIFVSLVMMPSMLVVGNHALMIDKASIHRVEVKKDASHYSETSFVTY